MAAKFDPRKPLLPNNKVPRISDYSEMEDRSRLKRVAIRVVSSANSVVDPRSMVWGGSVAGNGDLGEHHRAQIYTWNLAVYNEADI